MPARATTTGPVSARRAPSKLGVPAAAAIDRARPICADSLNLGLKSLRSCRSKFCTVTRISTSNPHRFQQHSFRFHHLKTALGWYERRARASSSLSATGSTESWRQNQSSALIDLLERLLKPSWGLDTPSSGALYLRRRARAARVARAALFEARQAAARI